MARVIGLGLAGGVFVASFALHIVGGATDQGWLFATAVVLIYASASGFGAIAWAIAGARPTDRTTLVIGIVAGTGLTASALWAANGRSFAWWEVPAGAALTVLTSLALTWTWTTMRRTAGPRGGQADPA